MVLMVAISNAGTTSTFSRERWNYTLQPEQSMMGSTRIGGIKMEGRWIFCSKKDEPTFSQGSIELKQNIDVRQVTTGDIRETQAAAWVSGIARFPRNTGMMCVNVFCFPLILKSLNTLASCCPSTLDKHKVMCRQSPKVDSVTRDAKVPAWGLSLGNNPLEGMAALKKKESFSTVNSGSVFFSDSKSICIRGSFLRLHMLYF